MRHILLQIIHQNWDSSAKGKWNFHVLKARNYRRWNFIALYQHSFWNLFYSLLDRRFFYISLRLLGALHFLWFRGLLIIFPLLCDGLCSSNCGCQTIALIHITETKHIKMIVLIGINMSISFLIYRSNLKGIEIISHLNKSIKEIFETF
jgi:hypothetical protein